MQRGLFILLVLSPLIAITTGDQKLVCDKKNHAVYTDCVSTCRGTCASQVSVVKCPDCPVAECKPGCICDKGYVKLNNRNNSLCVPPSSCPFFTPADFPCGRNTVPIPSGGCVDFCPPTCLAQGHVKICPGICVTEGCNCKEGYVRSEFKNSSCVPLSRCRCINQKSAMKLKLDNVQHAD